MYNILSVACLPNKRPESVTNKKCILSIRSCIYNSLASYPDAQSIMQSNICVFLEIIYAIFKVLSIHRYSIYPLSWLQSRHKLWPINRQQNAVAQDWFCMYLIMDNWKTLLCIESLTLIKFKILRWSRKYQK